jgi:hypothetical protein
MNVEEQVGELENTGDLECGDVVIEKRAFGGRVHD